MEDQLKRLIAGLRKEAERIRSLKIHEINNAVGNPKCKTVADNIDEMVDQIEKFENEREKTIEKEKVDWLFGDLSALYKEISELSKKNPDARINGFKADQINRVLTPLKAILTGEPSYGYLEMVSPVNPKGFSDKVENSYSDTVIILAQYMEACSKLFEKQKSDKRGTWSF